MTGTPSLADTAIRRTAWMTARARNAARRGWLIGAVGLLAVAGTLVALILVPREVDRALRDRISALPPMTDTLSLLARVDTARGIQQIADSSLRALRTANADRIALTTARAQTVLENVPLQILPAAETEMRRELGVRVARARTSPLVESYRAVGEADLLRNDPRARALLDSLGDVNRDREAYAALGGADARYAALTARLATLGQRLLAVAEQRLAAPIGTSTASPSPSVITEPTTQPAAPLKVRIDSVAPQSDSAMLAPRVQFNVDSVAERSAQLAVDSATAGFVQAGQQLQRARQSNADITARADSAKAEFTVRVPPLAMLLAALALGVAVGYGVALITEVRHPRVADAGETERIAQARVILHTAASNNASLLRRNRSSDDSIAQVIDTETDSYQMLHVALTAFGDVARNVRVASETPALAATVAINLAAAAARESRTALLVDGNLEAALVATLLRTGKKAGVAESLEFPAAAISRVVKVSIGRGQHIGALLAGAKPLTGERVDEAQLASLQAALQPLFRQQDLVVLVSPGDVAAAAALLPTSDVILCARVGATSLGWLTGSVKQLRRDGNRLRAVILWPHRAQVPR